MTLTLEIPDDLAPRLVAMPEKDRQSYTLAALRLAAIYGPTREPDPVLTPEQLASGGGWRSSMQARALTAIWSWPSFSRVWDCRLPLPSINRARRRKRRETLSGRRATAPFCAVFGTGDLP
nr:hypothetical protein [Armatimonas sp.]